MRVIVDLVGCSRTEPPYLCDDFEATSLEGLIVLHDFDARQITKRRSEESRGEFSRLMRLKWEMILRYGKMDELEDALKAEVVGSSSQGEETEESSGGCRLLLKRSWALPLVGATAYSFTVDKLVEGFASASGQTRGSKPKILTLVIPLPSYNPPRTRWLKNSPAKLGSVACPTASTRST